MLIITETGVPLAIFCAVSRIVIAAGYARPLTADINGVMPLASLGKKTTDKLKHTEIFCYNRRGRKQIHEDLALLIFCKQKNHGVNKHSFICFTSVK